MRLRILAMALLLAGCCLVVIRSSGRVDNSQSVLPYGGPSGSAQISPIGSDRPPVTLERQPVQLGDSEIVEAIPKNKYTHLVVTWEGRPYSWRVCVATAEDGTAVRSHAPSAFRFPGPSASAIVPGSFVVDGFLGKEPEVNTPGREINQGVYRLELTSGSILHVHDSESMLAIESAAASFGHQWAAGHSQGIGGKLTLPAVSAPTKVSISAPGYQTGRITVGATDAQVNVGLVRGQLVRFVARVVGYEGAVVSLRKGPELYARLLLGSNSGSLASVPDGVAESWLAPGSYTAVLEHATDAFGSFNTLDSKAFTVPADSAKDSIEVELRAGAASGSVHCEVRFKSRLAARRVALYVLDEAGSRLQESELEPGEGESRRELRTVEFKNLSAGLYRMELHPDLVEVPFEIVVGQPAHLTIDLTSERVALFRVVDAITGLDVPQAEAGVALFAQNGGSWPIPKAQEAEGLWELATTNPDPRLFVQAPGYLPWSGTIPTPPGQGAGLVELSPAAETWLNLELVSDGRAVSVPAMEFIEYLTLRDEAGEVLAPNSVYGLEADNRVSKPRMKYYHSGSVTVSFQGYKDCPPIESRVTLSAVAPAELTLELCD